jgi:hypothetical protein
VGGDGIEPPTSSMSISRCSELADSPFCYSQAAILCKKSLWESEI